MPTGYTADIENGIDFKQYALNCARAFDALITMRDQPHDAPIPEKFEPDKYHQDTIQHLEDELNRLTAMSDAQIEFAAKAWYEQELRRWVETRQQKDDLRRKYEAMLKQAKAYVPPTPDHKDFKDFMVDQIVRSIEFDCLCSTSPRPEQISPKSWTRNEIDSITWRIEYHKKENRLAHERAEARTKWVKALRESLENI